MARPRYAPGSRHVFRVRRPLDGREPATYLAARLSLPSGWTRRLLEQSCVRLNGEPVAADSLLALRKGDEFTVFFPENFPPHMAPTAMDLKILYEDDVMVVLDKPAGIVVHPARGHMTGNTLQNGLLHRYRDQLADPETTIGPAHRIDIGTSGVVVFSRTREAYRELTRQFAEQLVEKEYLAITDGAATFDTTAADAPLGIDPENPQCAAVVPLDKGGKESLTLFDVEEKGTDWTLVRARPKSGRPHQVRVHLMALGLPLIADPDYNRHGDPRGLTRAALHASRLTITHPLRGETMTFAAPLPDDLTGLLERLRG